MSHMQPQIVDHQCWNQIETRTGESEFVCVADARDILADLAPGDSVTIIQGFGARMSAPGYMDCTEWTVFETRVEAAEYLLETYYDHPDDEMTDDQRAEADELAEIVKAKA